MHHRQLKLGV